MTDPHYYDTKTACAMLQCTRMSLVTIWREEPSKKMPGKTGPMLWTLERLQEIAARHDRVLEVPS